MPMSNSESRKREQKRWIDRQGDVWSLGSDGLLHTSETRPFPWAHVEKKWGPLLPVECEVIPTGPGRWMRDDEIAAREQAARADELRKAIASIDHGQCKWIESPLTDYDRGFAAARANDLSELRSRAARFGGSDA